MDLVRVCQLESPRMLTLCCHYNVVTYSANASCASHGDVYSLHTASCLRGLNWYHMWLQLFQLFVLFTDIILSIISSPSAEVCHLNGLTHGWWLPCWLSIMDAALIWRCRIQGCFILKAQKCNIGRKRTFSWRKNKDAHTHRHTQTHSSPLFKLYPAEWSTWLLSEWLCVCGFFPVSFFCCIAAFRTVTGSLSSSVLKVLIAKTLFAPLWSFSLFFSQRWLCNSNFPMERWV